MSTTYKIGEAAALLNLKTYVLRFWETEFPDIAPLRTEKGQRLYTEEHLALLERIRYLLHERGLTIGGARKVLDEEKAKGVSYAFGMPGALSQAADWSPGAPQDAPAGAPALPAAEADSSLADSPQFRKVAEAVAAVLDRAASAAPLPPLPPRHGRPGPHKQLSQYNLPGLEELAAYRASALDSPPRQEYGLQEGDAEAPFDADEASLGQISETGGMLPLFAVAKAAFPTGKASGGDNFIQAGAASAARLIRPVPEGREGCSPQSGLPERFGQTGSARTEQRQGSAAAPETPDLLAEYKTRSRACLRGILAELESLAELLRR